MTFTPTPAEAVGVTTGLIPDFLNQRWVLFWPFAILLLVFLVIAIYALSHMWHLRIKGDATGTVIVVYIIFILALLILTSFYALTINWSGQIFG